MDVKRWWTLALVALVAGGAAAQSSPSYPDLNGQSLTVMADWTGPSQSNFEAVLKRFEQLTGAKVTYTPVGKDLATVLGTKYAGGNPPDIAVLPQPGLLAHFADQGALQPIDSVAGDLVDQNYAPVWRQLGTVNGTLYGVWFKAANKSLVWYNADIFQQAGVTPPKTWEQFMQDAQQLSDYGVKPFSIGAASAWTLTDTFENVYLNSAGPDMYMKLTKHEIPWTDPSVIKALTYMKQMWNHDWIAGGVAGAMETNHPQGVDKPFLDPPQAAMYRGADFGATAITHDTKAELGKTAKFFDFPSIDGSKPSVMGGGDVAVMFKSSPASEALIRYLASPESATVWVELGGFTSPNRGVKLADYPSPILKASAQALQDAAVFQFDMSDQQPPQFGSTSGQGEYQAFQTFLQTLDVNQTAQDLEKAAAAAYKQ